MSLKTIIGSAIGLGTVILLGGCTSDGGSYSPKRENSIISVATFYEGMNARAVFNAAGRKTLTLSDGGGARLYAEDNDGDGPGTFEVVGFRSSIPAGHKLEQYAADPRALERAYRNIIGSRD